MKQIYLGFPEKVICEGTGVQGVWLRHAYFDRLSTSRYQGVF
ncbi:hypothetical protein PN497_19620 [Sphaerospermopsis kisseleviana CS-549]|uniref:Uncharacterized protein n=1 Tax=Sphaerospermopsis kisseleviana CS-549 TaxID=3021783 RepID=A0ABT4ZWT5_9CYAN|nr:MULTISPECIES: hypothetical protein [Sphaerospermopsis]MDB9443546.1 hypothetical protein [Sphaerospermopsis kisseleviana CS-549]